MGAITRLFVRRPCLMFWAFLSLYLVLSAVGGLTLVNRARAAGYSGVFSPGTNYDWSVMGRPGVVNMDRARLANEVANQDDDYPGGVGPGDRRLAESGSGAEDEDPPERSQAAGGRLGITFLFFAKKGIDDLMTPPALKQMCEVENAILGSNDYAKVCLNASSPTATYTTDGNGTHCTLPTLSMVSLFYMPWDTSVHPVDSVRAAMASVSAAMALIASTAAGTANLQAWWNTAANAPAIAALKAAVEAASAAAAPLNPGGSYASAFDGLISGINAYVAQLTTAGFAVIGDKSTPTVTVGANPPSPSLYSLLNSLNQFLGGTGNLKDSVIDQLALFSGMPLRGLPGGAKAPVKGVDSFVQPGAHTRDCVLLDSTYVSERKKQLFELAHGSTSMKNAIGFFLSRDAMAQNKTSASRTMIDFGKPRMEPYKKAKDFEDKWLKGYLEKHLFTFFGMKQGFLYSAYRSPATTADLQVKFSQSVLAAAQFDSIVNEDFLMVIFALVFVYFYICVHTGSFAIGCFAILQIMISIPLALFPYATLMGVPFFSQVHILAIFLCLGVGADDVFVFMDAWRQSGSMPSMPTLAERMSYTYNRTFYAVFNTSFTTAVAFFASALFFMIDSSIMPIASFGVFAALAITFNWLLTVTWWPCAVLVWECYFCRSRGIGCCFSCGGCSERLPCFIHDQTTHPAFDPSAPRKAVTGRQAPPGRKQPAADAAESGKQGEAGQSDIRAGLSSTERLFHDYYAPALNWSVGPTLCFGIRAKPVSLVLVVLMASIGSYFCSVALTLTTPAEEQQWFPADHMVTGLADQMRTSFLSGEDSAYLRGYMYFGVKGVDAPDFDRWRPAENRGNAVFEPTFSLASPAAQAKFIQACKDLQVEDCIKTGATAPLAVCSRSPRTLASENTVSCFLKDWQEEIAPAALPSGAGFEPALFTWLGTSTGRPFKSDVGFVNGTVQFARIGFRYTAQTGIAVASLKDLWDRSEQFIDAKFVPSAELPRPFIHASPYSWMETSLELVNIVLQGFAIIYPCAFVILLLSTGSIVTSAYALLTLIFITGSLLGFVKAAFNFALGIGQAIAGNIVIGLSVDYTLHLAHAYMYGVDGSREAKVTHAATYMGVTVAAGSITTLGSAMCMAGCQLTFFTDMVILIGGTIGFSILYALLFFMPLMALAGPSGQSMSLAARGRAIMYGGSKVTGEASRGDATPSQTRKTDEVVTPPAREAA